jgi:carotenoid cleavage dioxygenase-like enzyme
MEAAVSAVLQRPSAPISAAVSHGRLRGFDSGAREIDFAELRVEGQLPDWLRGGLLLNGPALWDLPKSNYRHWFDGLAMMHRIQFGEGPVRYRSRFVRSEDYTQSLSAGAPAFSAFDTRDPQSFVERLKHLKHPRVTDNAAVVISRIGERWFATTESPYLVGFDPHTLETLGRMEFDDELGIQIMAAHGITDRSGAYWNVGITLGPKCVYKLFRLQPGSTRRELVGSIRVARAGYTHAFAMTPHHALIWETAMRAQPLGFLFSGRSYIHNFKWDAGHGSVLHAVSLADGSVRSWDVPAMMCFHAIQAYELRDEIVAELCIYQDAAILNALLLEPLRRGAALGVVPRPMRYRLRSGRSDALLEPLGDGFELPQVNPSRFGQSQATVAWGTSLDAAGSSIFFDRTVRLDLASGKRQVWRRPGAVHLEPLFVARPGASAEDDGVLLVPTLADDDAASVIGVIDAATMQCLATLHAPQVIPFGFHAAWAN